MAIKTEIIKAIRTIVQEEVNKAGFDKTRNGMIVKKNADNTYAVKIDERIYPIVINMVNVTFSVGDIVKVTYPCGNISQMYISAGKS